MGDFGKLSGTEVVAPSVASEGPALPGKYRAEIVWSGMQEKFGQDTPIFGWKLPDGKVVYQGIQDLPISEKNKAAILESAEFLIKYNDKEVTEESIERKGKELTRAAKKTFNCLAIACGKTAIPSNTSDFVGCEAIIDVRCKKGSDGVIRNEINHKDKKNSGYSPVESDLVDSPSASTASQTSESASEASSGGDFPWDSSASL